MLIYFISVEKESWLFFDIKDRSCNWLLINYNLDGLITQGVPCILARVPRNAGGKGGEDVEKGPSDDDIVVGT